VPVIAVRGRIRRRFTGFLTIRTPSERDTISRSMQGHDIIVIGASAGGVEALTQLVRTLPVDLPATVFIVLHISPHSRSVLPSILQRNAALPVEHARDHQRFRRGRIYIAPPDHHLLVRPEQIGLSRGPHENSSRPAVDPLFRSAARSYGSRVVAVVLTGTLDDGTAGLSAVKRAGGVAVVQSPDEAMYPGMPLSAIQNVTVDHVLPLTGIGPKLYELANTPAPEQKVDPMTDDFENDVTAMKAEAMHSDARPGEPSVFACPDCHGILFEIREGELSRFRCRTGHAYSPESLLAAQSDGIEGAMWTALRALEEKGALLKRMQERMRERGHLASMTALARQLGETDAHAEVLRRVLQERTNQAADDDAEAEPAGAGVAVPGDGHAHRQVNPTPVERDS
jgi:two-component system chemotaxis response regulator CheB